MDTYPNPEAVGSKAANSLGIYDLIGNAYEWCWDLYKEDYYATCEKENPRGPDTGFNPHPFDPAGQRVPPSTTDRVIKGEDFFTSLKMTLILWSETFRILRLRWIRCVKLR